MNQFATAVETIAIPALPTTDQSKKPDLRTVSVIIPAYNASPFIRRALDSVLAQTKSVHEVIVVDDGSKDSTCEVVRSYGSRVKLLIQENGGPSAARNKGISSSTGEFIAFLDADDWWSPTKIEKQLNELALNGNAVLCYTGLLKVDQGREEEGRIAQLDKMKSLLRIGNPCIPPSCIMVRRASLESIGGFSLTQKGCEDWDLLCRLYKAGGFCVVREALTSYLVSSGGLSGNADHMYRDFENMLDTLLSDFTGFSRWIWHRRIVSHQLYQAAMTSRGSKKPKAEIRYLLRSLATWPSPLWHPVRQKSLLVWLRSSLLARLDRRED